MSIENDACSVSAEPKDGKVTQLKNCSPVWCGIWWAHCILPEEGLLPCTLDFSLFLQWFFFEFTPLGILQMKFSFFVFSWFFSFHERLHWTYWAWKCCSAVIVLTRTHIKTALFLAALFLSDLTVKSFATLRLAAYSYSYNTHLEGLVSLCSGEALLWHTSGFILFPLVSFHCDECGHIFQVHCSFYCVISLQQPISSFWEYWLYYYGILLTGRRSCLPYCYLLILYIMHYTCTSSSSVRSCTSLKERSDRNAFLQVFPVLDAKAVQNKTVK